MSPDAVSPDDADHPDDADLAVALVTEAAALAARMRDEGVSSGTKSGATDLVTSADLAAEAHVTTSLARLRPDDGLLGEEGTARASGSGRTWVVDPVDGTWNFAHRHLNWCSALALRDDATGAPLLGAVRHHAAGETWVGGAGLPTTCNGVAVPRLVDRALGDADVATYVHPTTVGDADVREPFLAVVSAAGTLRVLGSASVDLSWVAAGRLGAWAQHSVAPWDWLPGRALVEAAGGATDVVEHRGHAWCLAGSARTVSEMRAALLGS